MADSNNAVSKEKESLQKFQQTLMLPPANQPDDVALTVFAVFNYAKKAYKGWWAVNNEDRRYYKGDQLSGSKSRPSYKSRIVDNETKAMIKTQSPKIINAINDGDLLPASKDDIEGAKILSQRINFAMKESNWKKQRKTMVKRVLNDGGTYIKCDSSVIAKRIDHRRIVREPEGASFIESNYYFDQILETQADTIQEFGAKAKNLMGTVEDLEANENLSHGPVDMSNKRPGMILSFAPPGESSPVNRYGFDHISTDFVKSDRILRLEMFVRDKTKKKIRKVKVVEDPETGESILEKDREGNMIFEVVEEPLYPHGRVVNVAIGVTSANNAVRDKETRAPSVVTLLDRPNAFKTLYEKTSKKDKDGKETLPGRYLHIEILVDDPEEGDVWVQSLIRDAMPLQDALNDAWNQLMDNVDKVVNPTKLISALAGLKKGQIKGRPNEEVVLDIASDADINRIIKYVDIPPIVQHMLPVIREIKDAFRNVTRVTDVAKGETPGSVTAGRAIDSLIAKAESGMLEIAERISDGEAMVKETLAYISQDFDPDEIMSLPNEDVEDKEQFIDFDPKKTRGVTLRVSGVRRKSQTELIQLITSVFALEAEFPGSGEMILRNDEDPRAFEMYTKLLEANKKAEAEALQGERDHDLALKATEIAGRTGQQPAA